MVIDHTIKIHKKLHPGLEWSILNIPISEDADDVIFHFPTVVCAKFANGQQKVAKHEEENLKSVKIIHRRSSSQVKTKGVTAKVCDKVCSYTAVYIIRYNKN